MSAAFRRRKPAWAVAGVDMAAVVLAVGAVHAINGMIFAVPAPAEVSTAHETKGDQLALSAGAEGQVGPSPVLARLAADARATLAVPDDLIVFAEPGAFVGRFGNAVNAPGEGAFASAGNVPRTDGNFPPPPRTAEPAEPDPTLLAYLPLPQLVSDAAAETVSRPRARVVDIAERATGAPLNLAAALGLDVSGEATRAGGRSVVTMSASTGASSTTVVGAAAEAAVDTSTRVAASATSTLGGAVKSVAGLLRYRHRCELPWGSPTRAGVAPGPSCSVPLCHSAAKQ
jgi:hypothetical protein